MGEYSFAGCKTSSGTAKWRIIIFSTVKMADIAKSRAKIKAKGSQQNQPMTTPPYLNSQFVKIQWRMWVKNMLERILSSTKVRAYKSWLRWRCAGLSKANLEAIRSLPSPSPYYSPHCCIMSHKWAEVKSQLSQLTSEFRKFEQPSNHPVQSLHHHLPLSTRPHRVMLT